MKKHMGKMVQWSGRCVCWIAENAHSAGEWLQKFGQQLTEEKLETMGDIGQHLKVPASSPPTTKITIGANQTPPDTLAIETVALALVMRATKVSDLPNDSESLPVERVIALITDAVYFRCTSPAEADAKEKELGVIRTTELPPNMSIDPDIYVRFDIENGGHLHHATSLFALKNGLQGRSVGRIRLVCRAPLRCPPEALRDFGSI
ncbi:MAG: hypothetical protein RMM98_17590 [Acidobacteriota bacterium]|nr:hypothetical protein [Acidobacteriota bacterium]